MLAAGVTALMAASTLVVSRATAPNAIWYPLFGAGAGVAPVDSAGLQLAWPAVGSSVDLGPAWVAGIAIVLIVFALGRHLGCSLLWAAAAGLALLFSGSFWEWMSIEQPATYAVLYALGTTGGLLLWRNSRRTLPLVVAAVCYALAVAGHPAALGALPALLWVASYGGIVPTAAIAAAAAAGATGFWLATGAGSSFGDWFAADPLVSAGGRLGDVVGRIVGDFGILGAVFLTIGFIRLTARVDRLVLLAGWAAGVAARALVWGAPEWEGVLVLAFAPLWLIVAVGMEWAATLVETRAARLGAAAVIVVLPVMSLAAHFETGARTRSASAFTDRYLTQLAAVVPTDPVILAEGGLLDRRLSVRADRQPGLPFARIPQTPDAVLQALGESRPVVGFAGAQENMGELGFRFEPIASAGVLMTVTEFLETVPDGWIVAVAAGPGSFRWILPGEGPTFGAIGGTQDLFGKSRWHYGLIGVKGSENTRLESSEADGVELSVQAAESLNPYVRAPVSLGVRSLDHRGAIVVYRGQEVASAETGIALAVMSPSGKLEAAYDAEVSSGDRFLVDLPELTPGLVTGREPCVAARPGAWTDVSLIAGGASLGGLTERDQDLTVYVAADHPLAPRQVPLRRPTAPAIGITAFDTGSTSSLSALREVLRADGLDGLAPGAMVQTHVYRIQVRSPGSRRQLALRLGGFATHAFARVADGPGAVPVHLCSAMAARVDHDVGLARHELFVFGWHPPERSATGRFRWTGVPRAELLLPMNRPERATIAIEAHPIAGAGTTLELWVNGTTFAPVALERPSVSTAGRCPRRAGARG